MAAEHATLLKDLMQTMESPADAGADSIVSSLVQRCRALQSGVQKVIQKIQDESVMATALQVRFATTCFGPVWSWKHVDDRRDLVQLLVCANILQVTYSSQKCSNHVQRQQDITSCHGGGGALVCLLSTFMCASDCWASCSNQQVSYFFKVSATCLMWRGVPLQVYEQLNEAVEKFNGEAAPERAESALVAGAGNSEAVQTPSAPQPPLGSTAGSPEPAHASSPPLATAAAAAAAPGPDLIDFGDDEGEPPAAAAAAGSGAPAGASDPMDSLTDVTPGVSVPEPAADAGAGHLAAALNAPVEDAPAGALDLEDAFAGVSLQQPASNTANTSENPFAS